jgi:hypothetical protein
VGVQSGGIPKRHFANQSEKLLNGEYKKDLNTINIPSLHSTDQVENTILSLILVGRIRRCPCIVTVDTGSSLTIVRPEIAKGLPERKPKIRHFQTVTGQIIPIFKEVLVHLNLHTCTIKAWALVADIIEEVLLGLDVMCAEDVVLDFHRNVLRIGGQEMPMTFV